MRHVDEGLIHAWLDGGLQAVADAGELPEGVTIDDIRTHLQSCADCRALAEEERELRERAGLVLRDALPARIDAPPFESAAPAAPRRRLLPLAWAASLLLAVGAGWWGSLLWRDEPQFAAVEQQAPGVGASVRTAPSDQSVAPVESLESLPATAAADAQGDGRTPQRGVAAQAAAAREAGPESSAEDAAVASAPVANAGVESVRVAALPPPAPPVVASMERGLRSETPSVPGTVRSTEQSAAAPSVVVPAARDSARLLQILPFTAATSMFRENVRRARDGEFEWLPLTPDDLSRSGTPPLTIAGAGAPHIAAAAAAVPSRLLRVRQALESGEAVELFVWSLPPVVQDRPAEPGAPPRFAPPSFAPERRRLDAASEPLDIMPVATTRLENDEHEVIVFVTDYNALVALRGRMPEETLRALLQRLTLAP